MQQMVRLTVSGKVIYENTQRLQSLRESEVFENYYAASALPGCPGRAPDVDALFDVSASRRAAAEFRICLTIFMICILQVCLCV